MDETRLEMLKALDICSGQLPLEVFRACPKGGDPEALEGFIIPYGLGMFQGI